MHEIHVSHDETIETLGHLAVGESPVWDEIRGLLWLVDGPAGAVIAADPQGGAVERRCLGASVGSLALRADGSLAVAVGASLWLLEENGSVEELFREPNGLRFNDGKCDTAGRWWVGTVSDPPAARRGHLYRVDLDRAVESVRQGVGMSNGIDWSGDGRRMYYVDTVSQCVEVCDFDPVAGTLGEPRVLADVPAAVGKPDGLTVDADDRLWLAVWGAGLVVCLSPRGRLERVVRLPARHVTSCCFGGEGLDRLYVTTAAWSDGSTPVEAHAGGVFAVVPESTGRPAARCAVASGAGALDG